MEVMFRGPRKTISLYEPEVFHEHVSELESNDCEELDPVTNSKRTLITAAGCPTHSGFVRR